MEDARFSATRISWSWKGPLHPLSLAPPPTSTPNKVTTPAPCNYAPLTPCVLLTPPARAQPNAHTPTNIVTPCRATYGGPVMDGFLFYMEPPTEDFKKATELYVGKRFVNKLEVWQEQGRNAVLCTYTAWIGLG